MQTRSILFLFLGISLLLSPTAFADESDVDLIKMVPASANGFIIVKDVPTLVKLWGGSPFARLWNDPQVKLFFAPLREDMEIDSWHEKAKEETGYELDQLVGMFSGDMVLYLSELEEVAANPDHDPAIVLLAEVGEHQDELEELLLRRIEKEEEANQSTTWTSEETRGVEMHIKRSVGDEPADQDAWAVSNGVYMTTMTEDSLVNVISELLDGGETESPIGASSAFQMARRYLPENDILLYIDLARNLPLMRQSFEEGAEEDAPVSPGAIFDALKLDNFLNLYLAVDLGESTLAIDAGATFTENQGLAKILAYGPEAASNPTFIPAGATSFGSSNFDIQSAWAELEVVLNQIDPNLLAMAAAQVNAIREGAGVELDLRKDLLENISGEIVMVQMPQATNAPGEVQLTQPEQVFAFGIKQRQGLELTIETLKGVFGQGSELFTERQFLGTSIYSLRGAEDQSQSMGVSYAVTDDHFLLSVGASDAALEAVLIAMQRPAAKPVWELDDVKLALAALPPGATGVGYQDLAKTGKMIFEMLSLMSTFDDELTLCNPEEMPDAEVMAKYLGPMSTGVYKDSNSLIVRVRLLPEKGVSE
jgi:hypothetical protein